MKCNQKGCDSLGLFRFTWPGKDEAYICGEHVHLLSAVAGAMGLHVQIIPVSIVEGGEAKA